MASRFVVPHQQKQIRGDLPQKNFVAAADGRNNRRVLQDIGNLVNDRLVPQGKKPVTDLSVSGLADGVGRGLVVTKVAAAAVKKVSEKCKPENVIVISSDEGEKHRPVTDLSLADGVGRGLVVTKVAAAAVKKVSEKCKPENVIVISSDEGEKHRPVSRRICKEGSSRKELKSFTSVLTARSKAACGLANKPKELVVDIDAADVEDELAVVEYVEDMYKYYKHAEVASGVHDYMQVQPEINAKMRSILVDWLIEVHRKFELMPETFYLTINIVDRFLAVKVVPRRELQLVGIGSMLIACKYEEIWAPEVNDFVCISDNAYTREHVLAMEKAILGKLDWFLTVPTPYVFLVRYVKASVPSDKEMENTVFFLAELGLLQYPTAVMYSSSMIAASAVYAARCTLGRKPFWTETLKHHTGYTEDVLIDCAKLLAGFHSAAVESKLKAVYKKFSSADRDAVALLAPAKNLMP